jgi:hypothetical protein
MLVSGSMKIVLVSHQRWLEGNEWTIRKNLDVTERGGVAGE